MTPKEKTFWICISCAKLKGYRLPLLSEDKPPEEKVTHCAICEMRTLVVNIDDLIPCWEDK